MGAITYIVITFSSIMLLCYFIKRKYSKHVPNAPPCVPSLPIVGSLPFIGHKDIHIRFTQLAQKYGNIYGLYMGSKYCVVLNGHEAIREALTGKQAAVFADRGRFRVLEKVWTDRFRGLVQQTYGDDFHKMRQATLSVLKTFGFGDRYLMEHRIHEECRFLFEKIRSLNGQALHPGEILEGVTLNILYTLMFSGRFDYDDREGKFLTSSCHIVTESLDVLYELFPALMLLPNVKAKLNYYREAYIKWLDYLEDKVNENFTEQADQNFITEYSRIVGQEGQENVNPRDLAVIIRDLMIAGIETTAGQLNWTLILLANHPEVQSRIQQEIDSVVERGRLPSWNDKPKLPYLEATILEVMRIRTAAPLSIPHCTNDDTKINEFFIPKNTQIFVNLWSAHMDQQVWSEPEKFRPERFLNNSERIDKNKNMISFSLGKRSCLGKVLARQEMFLLSAAMIQNFRILPPEGEDKVKDEMCFVTTLTAAPHTLRFVPRE